MTDQKLVDELEKALRDEAYDGGFGYMGDEQFTAYVRTLAETAAEVFEKALTPTDDDREVLAKEWADKEFPETRLAPENEQLVDAAYEAFCAGYDAGFRRSEVPNSPTFGSVVPEPSACLIEHPITGTRCSLPAEPRHAHVCDLPAEPQGEPSEAQERVDEARARALHDAFWAVHVGRFHGRTAEHGVDTFYAGTNAAKRAIESLHGAPIIRPWPAVTEQGEAENP